MNLGISADFLALTGFTEAELRKEVAIIFYKKGNISLGKAAEFAQIPKIIFQRMLADRQIPLNYDISDLEEDLKTLQQLDP